MKLKNKRILIISPHPDDEAIGCGGIISAAKKDSCEVFVLYMCIGKCRQLVTGSTDENTRLKELEKVAKQGGFKYKVLFIGKEFVRLDTVAQVDIINPIEDIIEEFKPDIILIPDSQSYDQDHRATYTACITALRPVPRKIRHFVPYVLMYEEPYTWSTGKGGKPNVYLNTETLENEKVNLMKLYASQDREFPFPRSGENLINHMRVRGSETGLKSAEAYVLLRGVLD